MSVRRISRPGHPTVLIPMDDGASPGYRSKLGIKGGYGNPIVVYGAFPVGKTTTYHGRRAREAYQRRPPEDAA